MALQDTLYALGLQSGRGVFDDPERLRGLLVQSGAPEAEVELVVDAARRGAHRGLAQALDAGTDPTYAVDSAGDRLAQERGTDPATARWAVAVLGFALGRVGENDVRRQRGPGLSVSDAPTHYPGPPQGFQPPPTTAFPAQPQQPQQPAYGGYPQQGYAQQPGAWSPTPPKKSRLPLLLGVGGTVLAIVVAVVLALVLTNGSDDSESADKSDRSTAADPSTEPSPAETDDPTTEPTTDEPTAETTSQAAPDGEVSAEAATGYTTALLAFSDGFGQGGEDLQAATAQDDTQAAKAAARKMRAAAYDLDLAVRDLELDPVATERDAFLAESSKIIKAFDEIERTAKSTLDVNGGVAGLPITDYTGSFQDLADAIDASRS